ncbi:MAG TPA: penicillin-binding protein 2 [Jatrophihabitans sp.]|nr:penicillin-binding protein 2 [Jatrophihabitans sp.]
MNQPPRRFGPPPSGRPVRGHGGHPARQAQPARGRQPQRPPVKRPPQRRVRRRRRGLRLGALNGRLRYGFAAVCTLLLVIGGRLVQIQGLDHGNYAAQAAAQRVDKVTLHALRGQILDRDGTVLAYTSNAQDITADPKQIKPADRARYAATLAPLLGVSQASILQGLAKPGEYALLATALSPTAAQQVENLNLIGIYTEPTTKREYPGGTTAANVIGTVHSDGSGAAGIEYELNSLLAGHDGTMTYSVDNLGNVNPASRTTTDPARNGATVRLTIDQNLQYVAQQYLDAAVPASGAKDAEMAILDAHTGQVLALASSGTFDASNPNTINPNVPIDPPVMSAFEPGSVQKAITFSAALQQKLITPQTVIDVPDQIEMGGVTIKDAWYHETAPFTATGILAESSNVGTLKIAQKIGPTTWYRYEKLFGVGTATGIELPGESAGYVPPLKDWSASTFANLPFGQGESMTILQLASIYQTIANNGVRIPPRIVQSITKADGSVQNTQQPAGIRVISPSVAQTVRTMLQSVILPGGTGVKAAIPGYTIAGKTGTAQQPDPNHGGAYSSWMNWDTFAGMVPAQDPQFVVAIMVDNPAHGVEGGDVAAPLFHQIATYEVQHAHVPPSGVKAKHVPLQICKGMNRAYLPANVC